MTLASVPHIDVALHKTLGDALKQWIALTGVDPEKRVFRGWHSMEARKSYKVIQELQELDPTGLSAAMILRCYVEQWAHDHSFSAHEIINRAKSVETQTGMVRKLIETLESSPVQQSVDDFMDWIRRAVSHYTIVDLEGLNAILKNKFEIAAIRRDAILAIHRLKAHQFLFGDSSQEPIQYSNRIYQFWNVNSLLNAMSFQPVEGVTLSLVRDVEVTFSYFAFGIRNGGNFILLTDKANTAHPFQKEMKRSRGKGREFLDRAFTYHFPYQMMEFSVDGETGDVNIPAQEGLVRYNQNAIILGKMEDLQPRQLVWLVMMLSLINDRYWREGHALPEQSFTGEMVAVPDRLVEATSHLPVLREDAQIKLTPLSHQDLNTDKLDAEGQWGRKPTKSKKWMEDRYGDQVPEDVFNLFAGRELPLLPSNSTESPNVFERRSPEKYRGLEPTDFGTAEHLDRERTFIARFNQAAHISLLAEKEFEQTKDEVMKILEKMVLKNKENLLNAVAQMEFQSVCQGHGGAFDYSEEKADNILTVLHSKNHHRPSRFHRYGTTVFLGGYIYGYYDKAYCADDPDTKATIFGGFQLMTPRAIADVCDVEVGDLPWQLQHAYENEPYYGNSILDRVDPLEWRCKNPWNKLRPNVVVCFCKRSFNRRRKALGLKPLKPQDWKKMEVR